MYIHVISIISSCWTSPGVSCLLVLVRLVLQGKGTLPHLVQIETLCHHKGSPFSRQQTLAVQILTEVSHQSYNLVYIQLPAPSASLCRLQTACINLCIHQRLIDTVLQLCSQQPPHPDRILLSVLIMSDTLIPYHPVIGYTVCILTRR